MKDKYFFHHLNSRFFEISGKDSKSFIQNLITNDMVHIRWDTEKEDSVGNCAPPKAVN